jgi:ceramide glucosyltransferase
VMGEHHEPGLNALTRHELRWMRTLRVLRPRSFPWICLTFSLPLGIVGLLLVFAGSAGSAAAWGLLAAAAMGRLVLHFAHRSRGERRLLRDLWLLPVRDALTCWVWCRSFFTSRVTWRGNEFDVDADGIMRRLS